MRAVFSPTILMTMALMAVIVMMVLPMPAWVLDIGLAASFALAILIFSVTIFIERPLDFSSFPTVLLASLMLRLSLNVSSTKLIIGQGHSGTDAAGEVIQGFASFIMNGSLFLGLVVFGVLLIVNFIVITKGAARMAEVGARFALDGMPGKQLAIDSDMSAGAIDHEEAKRRRETEQAETTFLGSLDGASKFVKGDAIAGLLITILNLVMGLIIGVVVHDMDFSRAFETYAILTVGDGLVSQIPAVIISIATALLLSRGGAHGSADLAVLDQLGKFPAALATVALLMAVFALFPGLPFIPFVIGAIVLGMIAWRMSGKPEEPAVNPEAEVDISPPPQTMGDVLDLDEIHVEFSQDLVPMILDPATGLDARITNMRQHVATAFGVILPDIRLTDDAGLGVGEYVIRVQGVEQARDSLDPTRVLALLPPDENSVPAGRDVREPVYGAPARWLARGDADNAALAGATVVNPAEVLATHLLEVIKSNLPRILSLKSLRRLLDELCGLSDSARSTANQRLFDELIPDKVPMDMLLAVLRLLLEERVSIRNLPMIVEAVAEGRGTGNTPETICEHVRQRLAFQIIAEVRAEDGTVPLIQLAPDWEATFAQHQLGEGLGDVALPPELFQRLTSGVSEKLNRASDSGHFPAIITSVRRRRFLRTLLAAKGITNPVVSFEELGSEARPSLVGLVQA